MVVSLTHPEHLHYCSRTAALCPISVGHPPGGVESPNPPPGADCDVAFSWEIQRGATRSLARFAAECRQTPVLRASPRISITRRQLSIRRGWYLGSTIDASHRATLPIRAVHVLLWSHCADRDAPQLARLNTVPPCPYTDSVYLQKQEIP